MDQTLSFGEWLRQRRKELDMTQFDLAERVGCSEDTIQKIERGARRPSKQVTELLAQTLQVPHEEHAEFVSFARRGLRLEYGQQKGTQAKQPGARSEQSVPTNLLPQLTSLVGREREVAQVRDFLLLDNVRLLTLTGPPGIGKTRLALEVAAALLADKARSDFADGVFFVELAPIRDPDLLATTIAATLEVKKGRGQSILEGLVHFLRDRQMLLVLDNFEQVLDAAPVVLQLLRSCPGLKVLVTSREALHVPGEQQLPVPPLQIPDLSQLVSQSDSMSKSQALLGYEAVKLFVQRARSVDPDFELTAHNAQAVAAICTRLDGLPLAIELAAARIKLLPPRELLARLDSRLRLLTTGSRQLRHLPARQQTLRGAIDWSYYLLDQQEQKLFRSLGVFVGGCSIEATQVACDSGASGQGSVISSHVLRVTHDAAPDAESLAALDTDVLDVVQSLIDKSLVRQRAGAGGEPRFVMLETISEYAREKLQMSGEAEMLRGRHAAYFLHLAEGAERGLHGPEQAYWLRRLEEEHDNFRAALDWSMSAGGKQTEGAIELGLRLAGALGNFWQMHGNFTEGRQRLEGALTRARPLIENEATGKAPPGIGVGSEAGGETLQAVFAKALRAAGDLAWMQSEPEPAQSYAQEALEIYQVLSDRLGAAVALSRLAIVAGDAYADYGRASSLYEQSLAILSELKGQEQDDFVAEKLASVMHNLAALVGLVGGNFEQAQVHLETALEIVREHGNQYAVASILQQIGFSHYFQADYTSARSYAAQSLQMARELRTQWLVPWGLIILAGAALRQGDHDRAAVGLRESLEIAAKDLSFACVVPVCLARLATLASVQGEPERAARLFAVAEALQEPVGFRFYPAIRSEFDRDVAGARVGVDKETWRKAWQEGRATTLEEAISYALDEK